MNLILHWQNGEGVPNWEINIKLSQDPQNNYGPTRGKLLIAIPLQPGTQNFPIKESSLKITHNPKLYTT